MIKILDYSLIKSIKIRFYQKLIKKEKFEKIEKLISKIEIKFQKSEIKNDIKKYQKLFKKFDYIYYIDERIYENLLIHYDDMIENNQ